MLPRNASELKTRQRCENHTQESCAAADLPEQNPLHVCNLISILLLLWNNFNFLILYIVSICTDSAWISRGPAVTVVTDGCN